MQSIFYGLFVMLRAIAVKIFVTNRAFYLFKIELENRDFRKSLYFYNYIVDAEKKNGLRLVLVLY